MKVELAKKIAACPLCGEESFLHTNEKEIPRHRVYWIKCNNLDCGCTAKAQDDQSLALRNWNRRAEPVA